MNTYFRSLLALLFCYTATAALCQVADPSACQYSGPNYTNPPNVGACLATIPSRTQFQYGLARNVTTVPYSLVDFTTGGPAFRFADTPKFDYHNASQNYTPYNQPSRSDYKEANGGGHDLSTPWSFNPSKYSSPNINVNVGFTVMIMSWIDEGEAQTTQPKDYVTLFDQSGNALYTLGRLNTTWGLRARVWVDNSPKGAFWQFPWDSTGADGYFQLVFYTFSPDGKVQINVLHDNSHADPNGHDFESSLLDFGSAMNPVSQGTSTSNPSSLNLIPVSSSDIELGQEWPGDGYGTAFQEIDLWTTALSRGQVAAYASSRLGNSGTFYPNSCNTGYMLNAAPPGGGSPGTVPPNVCGYSSNWGRKSPTDTGAAVQLSTTDLEFSTQASPQPYESADQAITVTNSGAGALSISAATLKGDDPKDFSVDADSCSGNTLVPGASCTLQVGYTDFDQRADATLLIQTNAATQPPVITLEGDNG